MKKSFCTKIAVFALSVGLAFAQANGDDMMKDNVPQSGDLYTLKVEPTKNEIMSGVKNNLNDLKKARIEFIKSVLTERKLINEKNKSNQKQLSNSQKDFAKQVAEERAKFQSNPTVKQAAKSNTKTTTNKPKTQVKTNPSNKPVKTEVEKTVTENTNKETKSAEEKVIEKKIAEVRTEEEKVVEKKIEKKVETNDTVEKAEQRIEKVVNQRDKFIDYAMGLQGTRYVYGGKTPTPGIDCSGLITYSAKNSVGIDLSGNAQNIYDKTVKIKQSEAVPGDLVFFKSPSDRRVSHVGIYLGNNQVNNEFRKGEIFLNAASGGPRTGVIVSGFSEPYWKRTLYGFGRFLPEIK